MTAHSRHPELPSRKLCGVPVPPHPSWLCRDLTSYDLSARQRTWATDGVWSANALNATQTEASGLFVMCSSVGKRVRRPWALSGVVLRMEAKRGKRFRQKNCISTSVGAWICMTCLVCNDETDHALRTDSARCTRKAVERAEFLRAPSAAPVPPAAPAFPSNSIHTALHSLHRIGRKSTCP